VAAAEFTPPDPPFRWEEDDDGEVSVSIPVPGDCQKKDVQVAFAPRHLRVAVQGHPLSPVVDGELLYTVKAGECTWALGGSGAKRVVTLTMEKVTPDEKWVGLLSDASSRQKKEISSMMGGMGLESWTPEHSGVALS